MPKENYFMAQDLLACHFGSRAARPAILAVPPHLWGYSTNPYSGGCLPLPPKGGYFLPTSFNRFILRTESLNPFPRTRLANLHDHSILSPVVAGINFFNLRLSDISESLAVELENLLRTNRPDNPIRKGRLVRNSNPHETHPGGTLGIFDDLILGGHFLFLRWMMDSSKVFLIT